MELFGRKAALGLALAAVVAWGAGGLGVAAAPASAGGAAGLYAPFPGVAKRSRARTFLGKTSIFVSANELKAGKFLTSEGAARDAALHPASAGGPSLRAGVNDPQDPGLGGWALGGAAVVFVIALGAAGPRLLGRSIRQEAN